MRVSSVALTSQAVLALVLASCDDDLRRAAIVSPVYAEPCQYSICSASGECRLDESGNPMCLCEVGYAGPSCLLCEPGFHRDALDRCITNKSCAEQPKDPCGANGDCSSDHGVIECTCEVGYEGPRCTLCSDRFARDSIGRCLPLYIVAGDGGVQALGGEGSAPCVPGYAGPQCTQCAPGYHPFETACVADDKCNAESCAKQGACDLVQGIALCMCVPGYSGTYCGSCAYGYHVQGNVCAQDDVCRADSCPAHASCGIVAGKITCGCSVGYTGANCADCAAGYHLKNSECVQDQVCQQASCPARAGCSVNGGEVVCTCHEGYAGANCDSCASGYHAAGSTCVVDQKCEASTCSAHATCRVAAGVTVCDCQTGYTGPGCSACGPGYHTGSGGGTCVVDETCSASRCSGHATCLVEAGATRCVCKTGWTGDRCDVCSKLGAQSVDFQTGDGWASSDNTCAARPMLSMGPITAHSRNGEGVVLLCAPSTFNGLTTRHIELEAIAEAPADLSFALPIVSLSLDYATRVSDLSLDVLADGVMVANIHLEKKSKSALSLQFTPAVKTIALRTSSVYTQSVGIDNITFQVEQCQ